MEEILEVFTLMPITMVFLILLVNNTLLRILVTNVVLSMSAETAHGHPQPLAMMVWLDVGLFPTNISTLQTTSL